MPTAAGGESLLFLRCKLDLTPASRIIYAFRKFLALPSTPSRPGTHLSPCRCRRLAGRQPLRRGGGPPLAPAGVGIRARVLLVHGTGGSTHSWADCAAAARHVASPSWSSTCRATASRRPPITGATSSPSRGWPAPSATCSLRSARSPAGGRPLGRCAAILLRMALDGRIAPTASWGSTRPSSRRRRSTSTSFAPLMGRLVERAASSRRTAAALARAHPARRINAAPVRQPRSPAATAARYERMLVPSHHVHDVLTMMSGWVRHDLAAPDAPRCTCRSTLVGAGTPRSAGSPPRPPLPRASHPGCTARISVRTAVT